MFARESKAWVVPIMMQLRICGIISRPSVSVLLRQNQHPIVQHPRTISMNLVKNMINERMNIIPAILQGFSSFDAAVAAIKIIEAMRLAKAMTNIVRASIAQ
eukprot:CAMPEP_0198255780 /NCGR_PEP_ID=MMETSP1447-20131203/5839_1 /TAXON_ID=420782 /ORGANISM="Chaetoceros dichaeta, Strain CCMP1751" /LENGTH=101 /DNA_ID=CAMNT_0043942239 /DNA_START=300 /DNA_END=605 /DNA_ORIENTATION=-